MKLAPFDLYNENYHLGHLFLDTMRSRPDAVCQIDAATGKSETNASVLARSIQLARCFRKFGVKPGDVLALGGNNHLDLHIPYYAALFNGMPIAGVDPLFKYSEIKTLFKVCSPRIAFCQKELLDEYMKVVTELGLITKVICFDEGKHSMAKFIEQYDDREDKEEFLPAVFDLDKIYAWLISTGGTTGIVKLAAFKHKRFLNKLEELKAMFSYGTKQRTNGENTTGLNLSPVQWVSGFFNAVAMPLMRQTKVQSSAPHTTEHIIDMINQYKPVSTFLSPSLATAIFKGDKECDFTCFNNIVVSGGKVHKDIHTELRKRMRPEAPIMEVYGQTENLGPTLMPDATGPLGNCGKESPILLPVKLVDLETGIDITEPNVPGELRIKGVSFSEYYNNPEETASSFDKDGWYKTGDILYKDEQGYFYFVERAKMLIKYRSYHIIPPEIEAVIRDHPGVIDVSVTSVPHDEDGEHPVACVMRRPDSDVTADEIKELVASNLSDSQRLRGGVVFMDQLPFTSTGKIARGKLRQIVLTAHRE